jgi:hypothetical protein
MNRSSTAITACATRPDLNQTTAETVARAAVAIEVPGVTGAATKQGLAESTDTAIYQASFSNALASATQSSTGRMPAADAKAMPKLRSIERLFDRPAFVVDDEPSDWSCLFTPEAKASLREQGLEHLLHPPVVATYLRGIEEPQENAYPIYATIEEIAAIEGPELRVLAIIANEIYGTCPSSRALIESVKDAGVPGCVLQMRLHPPTPYRKIWPWWYRPYKAPPRDLRAGNLFKAFGIDISGDNK